VKIEVSLKSEQNNGHFTWRPIYIFLSYLAQLLFEKCFRQKLYRISKPTFYHN